ncbi:hypothetical protein CSC2_16510 [Clostridium zeae]|uniref:Uncharacterized protein n=1 Tax=Clostridium zeae TaxID=2759022 RepID=A0ABQ1E8Z2_9CLOT|nr:hypothetical protein [Clostridium zeae]GFZ31125.1 hypothetical protein CSC2_16510 [Clostridium zeae]
MHFKNKEITCNYIIALNGVLTCKTSDYSVVSSLGTINGKDLKHFDGAVPKTPTELLNKYATHQSLDFMF